MGGGTSSTEKTAAAKAVRMPNPNDPAILAARAKAIAKSQGRGGRQSTILSDVLKGINGAQGLLGR